MTNNISPEMIKLLNTGDKKELHAFLKLYARPIYERALAITGNDADAKRVTRRAITETALLAAKGALEGDVDAQLMSLTDACCSEDLFFEKLVDDTMSELGTPAVPAKTGAVSADATPKHAVAQTEAAPPLYAPVKEEDTPFNDTFADIRARGGEKYGKQELPDLFDEDDENGDAAEDEDVKKPGPLLVVLIFLLSLITVALVWVLLVKLMYIGLIPKFDFGFAQWFNTNVFMLY